MERSRPGPKPSCLCGDCAKCRHREKERQRRLDPEYRERQRENSARYYREHPEAREKTLEAKRRWRADNPEAYAEQIREQSRRYRATDSNKPKHAARQRTHRAIKAGRLFREPCQECGKEMSEAHHESYDRPLDVKWLCRSCHMAEHRTVGVS